MKDDRLYLIHILECLARIEEYTAGGRDAFLADTRTQDAVLRNLQTMAESTQRLSSELKTAHPRVPWRDIAGFRNVLVHDYLGLNIIRVWEIVERDLPGLKQSMQTIMREMGGHA
ncbi:MAG: DUF86 domain-containing protein [Planctomycetes bacterium]|nr:DUF86 domain-containing protein [Planctomycetota bacterium]MBM4081171.1 DUF86 domain-containing protein [Planctomycetota bacterium]MBM4086524.1 DUF86 domain-containing protein [Planctomycetota bacterium]